MRGSNRNDLKRSQIYPSSHNTGKSMKHYDDLALPLMSTSVGLPGRG